MHADGAAGDSRRHDQRRPALPQDGIYRAILTVLVISVIAGAAAMLAGEYVFYSRAMTQTGTGAALICGVLYCFFRWLGSREARRHDRPSPGPDASKPSNDAPEDRSE